MTDPLNINRRTVRNKILTNKHTFTLQEKQWFVGLIDGLRVAITYNGRLMLERNGVVIELQGYTSMYETLMDYNEDMIKAVFTNKDDNLGG